jgi:hypothetical protein
MHPNNLENQHNIMLIDGNDVENMYESCGSETTTKFINKTKLKPDRVLSNREHVSSPEVIESHEPVFGSNSNNHKLKIHADKDFPDHIRGMPRQISKVIHLQDSNEEVKMIDDDYKL